MCNFAAKLKIMTFEEIKQIPDLQIEVTPQVEDAFYFVHSLQSELPESTDEETPEQYEERLDAFIDAGLNAAKRIMELPYDEKWKAINTAYRMIDNIDKYGVPCAAWT